MARILVSFSSHIYDKGEYKLAVFYDGFLNALTRCGNQIMAVNSADYLTQSWHGNNKVNSFVSGKKLAEDAKAFEPELIIAFNHSIPMDILENTNCPVAVWDADSIQFYNDKDYIKNNLSRYYFLCFSQAGVDNAIKFGAVSSRVHLVLAATDVQADNIEIDKNISFIGSNFTAPNSFINILKHHDPQLILKVVDELNQNFYENQYEILKKHNAEWIADYIDPKHLSSLSAVQNRISILNDVQELGLKLYGTSDWINVGNYLPWLAMCYDPKKVYSLQHNQDIYNSSRICLNISHAQATTGFPWRVMDIMASNGCLVSDKKSGLVDFTKNYFDIPMYESPSEAVELCRKILKDEQWRRDIVLGSQQCINDKGRWRQRFVELSNIFNLNLVPTQTEPFIRPDSRSVIINPLIYELKTYIFMKKTTKIVSKVLPKPLLALIYKVLIKIGIKIPYNLVLDGLELSKESKFQWVHTMYNRYKRKKFE